jgi:hypothetical protein
MSRRLFLKNTSLFTSSIFLNPLLLTREARAQASANGHFFILIQMDGGWDTTLSIDPLLHEPGQDQHDIFLEYQASSLLQADQQLFGPAFQPMMSHSRDLHIVKGIEMRRDAGHNVNLDIISCGYGDGKTAIFPVELNAVLPQNAPFGVLINDSIASGFRRPILTELNSMGQGQGASDLVAPMDIGFESESFTHALHSFFEAQNLWPTFQESLSIIQPQGSTMVGNDARYIAAAFHSGASCQAFVKINEQLDTHVGHEGNHLISQTNAWEAVADLFNLFKSVEYGDGLSLFDQTTFVVVSEFNRTPALNASRGKDHNPHANAVLFAGKGIRGGQSTGRSFVIGRNQTHQERSLYLSKPIDYSTGQVVENAENLDENVKLIFPENIAATVGEIFGQPQGYYSQHVAARPLLSVTKS